ncbi:MAG: type II toxin-antitoxin system HicB family antitoxin [Pyrinomonadaceae bacterium]
MTRTLTATIWRENDGFVALCPEFDIASQGNSIEEARANLKEAVELFLECAHPTEVNERLNTEIYVTTLEVSFGEAA